MQGRARQGQGKGRAGQDRTRKHRETRDNAKGHALGNKGYRALQDKEKGQDRLRNRAEGTAEWTTGQG